MMRISRRWQDQIDKTAFIEYEDQRVAQRLLREEMFFDAGFEHGRLAGRSESLAAGSNASPVALHFARQIELALMTSKLPRHKTAAILLQISRSTILGLRLPKPTSPTTKRR